jgi:uncharacterized protein (DUF2267 family)
MGTGLSVFDETLQATGAWLGDLQRRLDGCGRHQAYSVLRATLHVLRDALPPAAALQLAAGMPMLLRGLYLEGWSLAAPPVDVPDAATFLAQVRRRLPPGLDVDLDLAVRAVFSILGERLDPHGVVRLVQTLPAPLRELWREGGWETWPPP